MSDPAVPRPRYSLHARVRSFTFAFAGLRYLFASEHNMRVHGVAAIAAIVLALGLGLSRDDWLWLVLAIGLVLSAEAMNTAIERLADAVTMERHPQIGIAKDVAAAGVLVCSATAAIIGAAVFMPPLLAWARTA